MLDHSEPTITISLGLFTYSNAIDYLQSALNTLKSKSSYEGQFFLKSGQGTAAILDDFELEFGQIFNQLRNYALCDYAHKRFFNGFVVTEQYFDEVKDNFSSYCLPDFCQLSYQVREGRDIVLLLSGKKYELPYHDDIIETLTALNNGSPSKPGPEGSASHSLYLLLKRHRRLISVKGMDI